MTYLQFKQRYPDTAKLKICGVELHLGRGRWSHACSLTEKQWNIITGSNFGYNHNNGCAYITMGDHGLRAYGGGLYYVQIEDKHIEHLCEYPTTVC
jgi:hypothetical protein